MAFLSNAELLGVSVGKHVRLNAPVRIAEGEFTTGSILRIIENMEPNGRLKCVDLDSQKRIIDNNNTHKKYVYAGVHITTPHLFQGYEVQSLKLMNIYKKFKFENIYGFVNPLDWHHIDTVESLKEAEEFIDNKIN